MATSADSVDKLMVISLAVNVFYYRRGVTNHVIYRPGQTQHETLRLNKLQLQAGSNVE